MRRVIAILLLCCALAAIGQPKVVETEHHSFIKYKANKLHYDTHSVVMNQFFDKWMRMEATEQGDLNIVHIGSSHVQAGYLPNAVRVNLLQAYPSLVGGRGMIFPYSAAARCNNPADYRVRCKEKVVLTRNVNKSLPYPLGLCGIAVTVADSTALMKIILTDSRIDYATSRIVIIGSSAQKVVPRIRLEKREVAPSYIDALSERFVFNLSEVVDSFTVVIPCRRGECFTLRGIYLDNNHQGFSYHSIGVNGASVADYLKCQHFVRDLRLLHPDMVIFGIGINDAVPVQFDTALFHQRYLELVDSVRKVNPECAFVFITNNDSYRKVGKKKYAVNTNGRLAQEVFYRLAKETGGAVWDQYEVMGGLKSMERWRQAKLAQTDRVHFTRAGYQLIGDLFTNAMFEAYSEYAVKRKAIEAEHDNERYRYISY